MDDRMSRIFSPIQAVARSPLQAGVSGACACLISNPIDIARARIQVGVVTPPGLGSSSAAGRSVLPSSTFSALRGLASTGALRLGLGPAIGYNFVFNAARFTAYDALSDASSGASPMASGFAAGLVGGWLSSPLARARTIMQVSSAFSITDALRNQPFAAAPSWALRNAAQTAFIFSFFEYGRLTLEEAFPKAPLSLLHLAASVNAATISCVLLCPLDLACTIVFSQSASREARPSLEQSRLYASPLDCARQILAREGAGGLYRGLGASLLRMVPHTGVTFLLMEVLRGSNRGACSQSEPSVVCERLATASSITELGHRILACCCQPDFALPNAML